MLSCMDHIQRLEMKIGQGMTHGRSDLWRSRPLYLKPYPPTPSDNQKIQFYSSMGRPEETFLPTDAEMINDLLKNKALP